MKFATLENLREFKTLMMESISNQGYESIIKYEPLDNDIPKVFFDGAMPTTKDDVLAEMTYISKTINFHSYITIKCQGTSSMKYPKKNYLI